VLDLSATPWRRVTLSVRHDIWCLVDADDYDWIILKNWNWGWHTKTPHKYYAKRNIGPARSTVYLHREIMARVCDPPAPGLHVDHRNGQSLDNRKANLRWVTPRENIANRFGQALIPPLDRLVAAMVADLAPAALELAPF
jgi:hypothetical protein